MSTLEICLLVAVVALAVTLIVVWVNVRNERARKDTARADIEAVLAPVKTSIDIFTRDFKACYDSEHADRAVLKQGIDSLAQLNRLVGEETRRLTHALKGDKGFQGQWGEMILANVLEHSGLERGRWLVYQYSHTDDEGRRLRPDAVITCPHGRKIIIDSKCSLTAYMRWATADTDAERAVAAKAHVAAIDTHIKTLASKAYQDSIDGDNLGFVIMFMPNEGAFITAMHTDENLWQRAYDARVIIASPVHLVAVIKIIEQMWVTDDRNTNAQRIAEEAVNMLDKLTAAFEDLEAVGKQLDKARDAYDAAINKLRTGKGNVARRISNMAALGAKPSRPVPAKFRDVDD